MSTEDVRVSSDVETPFEANEFTNRDPSDLDKEQVMGWMEELEPPEDVIAALEQLAK